MVWVWKIRRMSRDVLYQDTVGCIRVPLLSDYARHYTGIDLRPPADIVGDIRQWRRLGLRPESFDVVIAFEVVEPVDCLKDCYDLLQPGDLTMLTTAVPCMDWALKLLEKIGLSQTRTSPHDHLVRVSRVAGFEHKKVRIVGLMSQWAIPGKKL